MYVGGTPERERGIPFCNSILRNHPLTPISSVTGGVGNEAAEEDWRWDLNPGKAVMLDGWDHVALVRGEPCSFGAPFATRLRKLGSKM